MIFYRIKNAYLDRKFCIRPVWHSNFQFSVHLVIKQTTNHLESSRKDASFATNPRFLAQFVQKLSKKAWVRVKIRCCKKIHFKAISPTLVNFWTCNFNHLSMLIVNFKCCLVGRKKKKWGSPCSFSFHRASKMTCFFPIIMNYIRNVTKNNSQYFQK